MRRPSNRKMNLVSRLNPAENEEFTSLTGTISIDTNDDTPTHRNSSTTTTEYTYSNNKGFRFASSSQSFFIVFVRKLGLQWKLLSRRTRIMIGTIGVVFLVYFLCGVVDNLFYHYGNIPGNNGPPNSEASFAVAINTYKRPDMLKQAVQHYAQTCGKQAGVAQVFVIWAEQGAVLPDPESFFPSSGVKNSPPASGMRYSARNRAEVVVLQKDKDSLNSRFEPIDRLQWHAVFMVDDDVRVDCDSLHQGFRAWKENPYSMVSYYPRLASPPRRDKHSDELVYHGWPVVFAKQRFNFVLTKASFLHSDYLALYSSDAFPQEIKDHVDQNMNCEDIAMSLLVANYTNTQLPRPAMPIYVQGSIIDRGLIGGISTGSGHMSTRSECLTKLTSIFKKHGWKSPLDYSLPLRQYSWLKHKPGFWFQQRPSNVFEWFAFGNTFT